VQNAPTPERRQHSADLVPPQIDDAYFRPFWRVCDRVEALCTAGLITLPELRAAHAFRALYERAHAGPGGLRAMDLAAIRIDKHCRRPVPAMTAAQAEALAGLRRIKEALGALFDLLELALIEEVSWAALGRRLGVDCRTARTWAVAAISALAAL
jgi:hypothetical protein